MSQAKSRKTPWGPLAISEKQTVQVKLGDLVLWMRKEEPELLVAHAYGNNAQPAETGWTRLWVEGAELYLAPALPDLPVVVRTEHPFCLPPDHSADLTVVLPLWAQLRIDTAPLPLLDFPTVPLSKSWFGTFTDGALSYWVYSDLWRGNSLPNVSPCEGLLAIHVSNNAHEMLQVDHFAIPAPSLSLYSDGERFWLESLTFSYRGQRLHTQTRRRARAPRAAGRSTEVAAARESAPRTFAGRVFGRRGELPGIGVRFR